MSETAPMEQFNINELAGATGLILGAVGGILAIVFKSRCYCKFRIGISDKFNLCMCERKPPPDTVDNDGEDGEDEPLKDKGKKGKGKKGKDIEKGKKDDETLIPPKSPKTRKTPKKEESGNIEFDITDNED